MATTLSNLNQARIEMAIQQALKNALVPLNAFSIGLSTDGMIKDDVIRVPVTVDPTAQNKTLGTATTDDGSITGVNVTLNTPKTTSVMTSCRIFNCGAENVACPQRLAGT